jgi:hypothetical protein
MSALIALGDVPSWLAEKGVRRTDPATVRRWASRGLRGVRLRVLAFGRQRYTTEEWLRQFAEAVGAGEGGAR